MKNRTPLGSTTYPTATPWGSFFIGEQGVTCGFDVSQNCRLIASMQHPGAPVDSALVSTGGGERPKGRRKPRLPRPSIRTKPVRGVQLLPLRPDRPNPFGVQWNVRGERFSAWFSSLEKLEAKVVELNAARRHGTITDVPTTKELHEWRVFRAAAGKVSPMEIFEGWKLWRKTEGRPVCDVLVSDAVHEYMEEQKRRLDRETIKANTLAQKKFKLARFKEAFALKRLDEVTKRMLEDWIDGLKDVKKSKTQRDYLKHIRPLFRFYSLPSPTQKAEIRPADSAAHKAMAVQDAAKLLDYTLTHYPQHLVRLACEMFLGLRTSSAARLTVEHLDRAKRLVHITRDIIKTRSTHSVSPPANIWPWIEKGWEWFELQAPKKTTWMHAKSKLYRESKVPHPHNVLRHTFCSYHLAAFQNPGSTAWLLMHKKQDLLWQTYRETATPEDGLGYFSLRPGNVARVAESGRLPKSAQTARPRGRG